MKGLLLPTCLVLSGACASAPGGERLIAESTLRNASGTAVGTARIVETAGGPRLRVDATALPTGTHGIHIHTIGRCEAPAQTPFSSAGGHFNPTGREHGLDNPAGPHAGDLPNIVIAANGTGSLEASLGAGLIGTGTGTLFDDDGSAIVVHQNTDDQRTNDGPAGPGNSGPRIACGVLVRA